MPDFEQAQEDLGSGVLIINRNAKEIEAQFTGSGAFKLTQKAIDTLRALFDRAEQAVEEPAPEATPAEPAAPVTGGATEPQPETPTTPAPTAPPAAPASDVTLADIGNKLDRLIDAIAGQHTA